MSLQTTAGADTIDIRPKASAGRRWEPVYDFFFNLPFQPGRAAAARAVGAAAGGGGELLIVGVGVGLELPMLPRSLRVTGVDVNVALMRRARERIARRRLFQVKTLQVMDAASLEFERDRFDVALAPYVMSAAQRPRRVLDEMWRVLRPGGQLIILNHFTAKRGVRSHFERAMELAAELLGWHPDFPYAVVGDWLARHPDAILIERRRIAPFRLFTLLRVQKAAPASAN